MRLLYYTFIFILLVPSTAFAYLDPGTGNILVYIVISLIGAVAFSLKGAFYKLIGKKGITSSGKSKESTNDIVIFSEGKNYWNTFKPVVDALIKEGHNFSYYTMDVDDPALTIESNLINNRYIGKGNMAYAKLGKLKAGVVLATTPNIGTEGYPLSKSKDIKCLAHVFHAVDDLAYYHKGSLDYYDAVLLVGGFEIPIIRQLEHLRKLPEKELIPAGLPYMDVLASKIKPVLPPTDGKTILIGPSWGTKGCLYNYGSSFIETLAKEGYNIIVRPHPQSWKAEKTMLDKIRTGLKKYSNIIWDNDPDGSKSLEKADILISDTSAIRFDFAFLYQRPVITLESPAPDPEAFEIIDLKEAYMETAIQKIGYTLNKESVADIAAKVKKILSAENKYDVASLRTDIIYNWGKSGEVIAQYLISKSIEQTKIEVK